MNLHIFHRQAFVFDFVSFKLSGSLEKMPGFFFAFLSLFFFYFRNSGFGNRGFGNYANVYRLNYRLLSANIWCMLLYLENLFFEPRSEVFWVRYLLYCDARKKDFDASNKPSQCFKWTIAMFYSLYFDALSAHFMCSIFTENKFVNSDIEQRSL